MFFGRCLRLTNKNLCNYFLPTLDSADVDLDALLGELCALESQLNSNGPDSLFGKWTSKKPTSSSSASTPTMASNNNLQPPKPKRVTAVQKNVVDVDKMNVIVDHQQQQHAVTTTATATTKILVRTRSIRKITHFSSKIYTIFADFSLKKCCNVELRVPITIRRFAIQRV